MLDGLVLFALTEALFSAAPGPAVVMVVAAAMVGGWRAAQATVFGVLLGNLIYFVISCGLILSATQYNDELFFYVKMAGAGYLLYLLFGRYVSRYVVSARRTNDNTANNKGDNKVVQPQPHAHRRYFLGGLIMQLANPKTIVFFSAFLPQFVDVRYNIALQFLIMAGLSWAIEYTILVAYIAAAQSLKHRFNPDWGSRLEHVGNAVMAAAVGWSWFAG